MIKVLFLLHPYHFILFMYFYWENVCVYVQCSL